MSAKNWAGPAALLALLLASPAAAQEGLRWEPSLESAQRLALETNRLVLIHFGAPWCSHCQRLEQQVFSQPGFGRELTERFVAVKLNFDHYPATARQYGVESIPADVIVTPQGELVERLQNPPRPYTAADYAATMNQVAQLARPHGRAPYGRGGAPDAATMQAGHTAHEAASSSQVEPGSGDRYADYYNRRYVGQTGSEPRDSGEAGTSAGPPTAQQPGSGRYGDRYADYPVNPANAAPRATLQAGSNSRGMPAAQRQAPPQIPPGNPPLGLDGYCPVTLSEARRWEVGDARWGAIHRGRTYLFTSSSEQQKFLRNPDRYSPVISGNDPVLALDHNRAVPGRREFGVFCDGRIFLFASEASRNEFERNPNRYAADIIQAMR